MVYGLGYCFGFRTLGLGFRMYFQGLGFTFLGIGFKV